jgi:ABC-type molybdate transport system substrate-binding protein
MTKKLLKVTAGLIAIVMVMMPLAGCTDKQGENITLNISAAASLTDALNEINSAYKVIIKMLPLWQTMLLQAHCKHK